MTKAKTLVLIDGKSVFYRGFYAMPNLATTDGVATGGVYGFAMLALELFSRIRPDYVAVAWDKAHTNVRRRLAIYPKYKAGRTKPPESFYSQIPLLRELLDALNWPFYECDDYEADDLSAPLNLLVLFTILQPNAIKRILYCRLALQKKNSNHQ